MGVGKILSGNKCLTVITAYPEDQELEDVKNKRNVKIPQDGTLELVVVQNKPMVKSVQEKDQDQEVEGVQNKPMVKTVHSEDQEVEGESNERSVKMTQEETLEVEGVQNKPMVKTEHPEEEDTTSVFTHCTSVEPVANPWESTMRVCLNVRLQIL
jgi:hypothetical protein